jgi:hypothetical protein
VRACRAKAISAAEVARHTKPDDCWLIVKGKVYDVSGWGKTHPGGEVVYTYGGKARRWRGARPRRPARVPFAPVAAPRTALVCSPRHRPPRHALQDATDVFSAFHAASTWQLLRARQVGTCSDAASELLQDFRRLRADMQAARLFESSPLYYVWKARAVKRRGAQRACGSEHASTA